MSLFVNVLFGRLSGRYYYEFFYPCSILAFIAIVCMLQLTPIISVGISVAVLCCSFLLTAEMASNYPSIGVTTTLDNFSAISNAFILMSFILQLSKVQSAWRLVAALFLKLLPLLKYLLAIIWPLVDLFYLSTRKYWPSNVVYLDDDWNLHG